MLREADGLPLQDRSETLAIELIGIDKRFGPVHANRDIDLQVERGTIHGIVGENGAGKSTLMSILYGFYQADAGEIRVERQADHASTTPGARSPPASAWSTSTSCWSTTSPCSRTSCSAPRAARCWTERLAKARAELRAARDANTGSRSIPTRSSTICSVGLQQRVEILKALYRGADILILDEPTGVLTPAEADHLFRILEQLKEQGKTIILITHKLREIMAVTDDVSVMRRGEMVATRETAETTPEELAELMVGRRVLLRVEKGAGEARRGRCSRSSTSTVKDGRGVTMVDDVSFDVRAGEIVGIAGVAGNGQSELLEVLAGIRRAIGRHASCSTASRSTSTGIADPATMRRLRPRPCAGGPPAHGPGARLRGVRELDPRLSRRRRAIATARSSTARRSAATPATKIENYDIRPPNCRLKTANFSGGNQQKIVLAREMERDPEVLLVGQPTRGVDIGAIEFIHRQLVAMRDARQGDPARLGRARRDPLALRPHPGHVRRPHRRRARPGGDRARARPADGRRRRRREAAE